MEIHIVQKGETIESIADKYGIPVNRLIEDNGLPNPRNLVVGQSIVIAYPEQQYTVQEGDTLESISKTNNISVKQLYRNNRFLFDREYIYPGESLIISYGEKRGSITTNGYANSFINRDVLKKTLPYLTYLTISGYGYDENGNVSVPEDEDIIRLAKELGVAPVMLLTTLNLQGVGSSDIAYNIVYSEKNTDNLIDNILEVLKNKGLDGINLIYTFLTEGREAAYTHFTEKLSERLTPEGFQVIISIPPKMTIKDNTITFEQIDYSGIGQFADQIIVMEYNWGFSFNPPVSVASVTTLHSFLDYLSAMIPQEKMVIGIPLIGYIWRLPYFVGISKANAISSNDAILLAMETGSEIQFNEESQTPYFEFTDEAGGIPRNYIVWFIDARSIEAFLNLVEEFNTEGIAVWNIMSPFPQLWLIVNIHYDIEAVLI